MNKQDIAKELFELYKTWHIACVQDFRSEKTELAEHQLWLATKNYPGIGLPTKITASIGRWCARQLKISVTAQEWY